MSEDGGGSDTGGGDKGGGDYGGSGGGGGGDFFSNPFGSSDDYHATSYSAPTPSADYTPINNDFDLDYLSSGGDTAATPTGDGGGTNTADSGGTLPGFDYGSPIYGDTALPSGASPVAGSPPSSFPTPNEPGVMTGPELPAGYNSAPNVTAVNTSPMASIDSPGGIAPAGISAGSGLSTFSGPSTGGGSGDLTSSKNDSLDWLKKSAGGNPLGTAIAAAGLGFNVLNSKKMSDSLKGPTGLSPGANLAELAAPAAATGRALTDEGRAIAVKGSEDLRARAALTDPNAKALMDKGTGLTSYVGTGKLPAEMQLQLDQGVRDAKTARISWYASRNMPTDPTKNTSLRADLEGIDRQAVITGNSMAAELAKTGTGLVGTGSDLNKTSGGFERSSADIGSGLVTSGITSSGLASKTYDSLARIDNEQSERTMKAIAAMAAALNTNSVTKASTTAPA